MTPVTPTKFLNLDLELRSHEDLTPLATHFETCGIVLFNGASNAVLQLTVEPLMCGLNESPQACTDELLQTIRALPSALLELFNSCTKRIFDYGFESGAHAPPFMVDILAIQLFKISQLEIDLRVTLYPHDDDLPARYGLASSSPTSVID